MCTFTLTTPELFAAGVELRSLLGRIEKKGPGDECRGNKV